MEVVEKRLEDIIPYNNNPRVNDGAVEAVANSIKEFGFKSPIIVDEKNVIVCGHTRYKAACKLGLMGVPCIVAKDLTPKQIKAFRLADNKTAELADWDFEKLNNELDSLDFDMGLFGFEELKDNIKENKNDSKEINLKEFEKDNFDTICPRCGMRFNINE